jgi:hypothetical protein
MVAVSSERSHEPPCGTGPSVTANVTVTGPGAVHVKLVDCASGAENLPLSANHAYVRAEGSGAVADAVRAMLVPTVVSDGAAVMPFAIAQSKTCPLIAADPPSAAGLGLLRSTVTSVVILAVTENGTESEEVTRPSSRVPESVTV